VPVGPEPGEVAVEKEDAEPDSDADDADERLD
jgi:hypothetical protein